MFCRCNDNLIELLVYISVRKVLVSRVSSGSDPLYVTSAVFRQEALLVNVR